MQLPLTRTPFLELDEDQLFHAPFPFVPSVQKGHQLLRKAVAGEPPESWLATSPATLLGPRTGNHNHQNIEHQER